MKDRNMGFINTKKGKNLYNSSLEMEERNSDDEKS